MFFAEKIIVKKLQEASQRDTEIEPTRKQVDQNAEVWRCLMSADETLFFLPKAILLII